MSVTRPVVVPRSLNAPDELLPSTQELLSSSPLFGVSLPSSPAVGAVDAGCGASLAKRIRVCADHAAHDIGVPPGFDWAGHVARSQPRVVSGDGRSAATAIDLTHSDGETESEDESDDEDRAFINNASSESDYSDDSQSADEREYQTPAMREAARRTAEVVFLAAHPELDKLCLLSRDCSRAMIREGRGVLQRDETGHFSLGAAYIPTMPWPAPAGMHCRHNVASVCDFCRCIQSDMLMEASRRSHVFRRRALRAAQRASADVEQSQFELDSSSSD